MKGGASRSVRAAFGFNQEPMNRIRFHLLVFLVLLIHKPIPAPPVAPFCRVVEFPFLNFSASALICFPPKL